MEKTVAKKAGRNGPSQACGQYVQRFMSGYRACKGNIPTSPYRALFESVRKKHRSQRDSQDVRGRVGQSQHSHGRNEENEEEDPGLEYGHHSGGERP